MTHRSSLAFVLLALWAGLVLSGAGTVGGDAAPARQGQVEVSADKDKITIGDEITVTFSIRSDLNTKVLFPKPHLMDLGDFRLKKARKFVHEQRGEELVWEQALVVTTFEVGERTLPAQKFLVESGGTREPVMSESLTVTVDSVLALDPEAKDIRGLKGQRTLPIWWKNALWIAGLIAVVILILFFFRRPRPKLREACEEPARPCFETALEALETLKREGLVQKGHIKEYYIRLSGIIRTYLEARYGIVVLDRTTAELLAQMKAQSIDQDVVRMTRSLLEECDLVKFAKFRPQADEAEASCMAGVKLVEVSKPLPAPEPVAPAPRMHEVVRR
ncbi:MAG: hypothetical protein HYY14_01195 [Candidatus Omnitrophica bacterium]|nr:hypothetical protein [Candidatus Omnitrophota bacterium]